MARLIKTDIQKTCKSPLFLVMAGILAFIMIADPISVFIERSQHGGSMEPYCYFLLMNTVSWGANIYYTLYWLFPVLLPGQLTFQEYNSSFLPFSSIRVKQVKYYTSKIITAFIITSSVVLLLNLLNIGIVWLLFPGDAEMTRLFLSLQPDAESFARNLFEINPLLVALLFAFINSIGLGIWSIFAVGLQILFKFRKIYTAIAIPFAVLYIVTLIFDRTEVLLPFDLKLIAQPATTYALSNPPQLWQMGVCLFGWLIIGIIVSIIGIFRNRDVI